MKPPDLIAPPCPYCQKTAVLVPQTFRVRRGDRVLPVNLWSWECPSGCPDPDQGVAPFRFSDPPLMRVCDELMRAAWLAHFGEPLPPSERRGRKTREARSVRVPVLLTPTEAEALDAARGERSRSDFLRQAIPPHRKRA